MHRKFQTNFYQISLKSEIILYGVLPVVAVNEGSRTLRLRKHLCVCSMQAANDFNPCNTEWSSEPKWAVRLSERIPAAKEVKAENQGIPIPKVQIANFAQAESG